MSDKQNGDGDNKLLYCSFCGKSQHEVRKLIAGPSVFICDECVELCNDIIREEIKEIAPKQKLLHFLNHKKFMHTLMTMSLVRNTQRKCCR